MGGGRGKGAGAMRGKMARDVELTGNLVSVRGPSRRRREGKGGGGKKLLVQRRASSVGLVLGVW